MYDSPLPQVTVEELAQKIAACEDLQLVDVREVWEVETAGLPGFIVLPLSNYAEWSGDIHDRLDAAKETLVLCHHGMRSAQMCRWLTQQGFTQVKNIAGGIDAYAIAVDRSIPRY
jgi:rhodanese-related sulfurtransferase